MVESELEPGERIEWMDTPIPRFFTGKSTAKFLFAIPWTAFAIFWMYGASGFKLDSGISVFALFGLPFVLIGIAMLLSPIWAYCSSLKTVYVVTDRRAITFDGGRTTTIRSYPPEKLAGVFRRERKDGSGDVILGENQWKDSNGHHQAEDLGFLRITNPREIEQSLKKLAEKAKPVHHS